MLCRRCQARPIPPSHLRACRYRCTACRQSTPAAVARRRRYFASDKRKAVMAQDNARRIWVGRSYAGRAATGAQAGAIQAHIRQRVKEFQGATIA